jgi:hypothetical protein
MIAGYEPTLVATLTRQSLWAAEALAGISSSDGAAIAALATIGALRSVVETGVLQTTLDIGRTDPLVRRYAGGPALRPLDPWLTWRFLSQPSTRFADLSDAALFFSLQVELTRQVEQNGLPDLGDSLWSALFADYITEFKRRARSDPDFARLLIDEALFNPLIGMVVAMGGFSTEVVAGVLAALVTTEPLGTVRDAYRERAIEALLQQIVNDPSVALDSLARDGVLEALLLWNDGVSSLQNIPESLIGDMLMAALAHAFYDPTKLDLTHALITEVAHLAHERDFDRGFAPEIALAIATGLLPYLPYIVASLELSGPVYIKNFDGDRNPLPIGNPAEVVDLFGALLRDAQARAHLIAAIIVLSVTPPNELFQVGDLADYVHLLVQAADTEQIEEEIKARRDREFWNTTIDVVARLIDHGLGLGGPALAPVSEVVDWIATGASWLVNLIDARQLGLDDVERAGDLLLTVGLAIQFVSERRAGGDDDPRFAEAEARIQAIEQAMENSTSYDDFGSKVEDLEDLLTRVDPYALPGLSDRRTRPRVYDAETDADLSVRRAN